MVSLRMKLPDQWGDYSLDLKLLLVFEVSMIVAAIIGDSLAGDSDVLYFGLFAAYALFLFVIAKLHREIRHWHWPGVGGGDIVGAILTTIFTGAIAYVFLGDLPSGRSGVPLACFVLALVLSFILQSLKLMAHTQDEFDRCCEGYAGSPEDMPPQAAEPPDRPWIANIKALFALFFLLAWLEGFGFFVFHQIVLDGASPAPTVTQSEEIQEKRAVRYVSPLQKHIDDWLLRIMVIAIPTAVIGGLALQGLAALSRRGRAD